MILNLYYSLTLNSAKFKQTIAFLSKLKNWQNIIHCPPIIVYQIHYRFIHINTINMVLFYFQIIHR